MAILIISSNSLFKEVIIATVAQLQTGFIELSPEEALIGIHELRPDVIIIDEATTLPYLDELLSQARRLQKTRIIILNPNQNEIFLWDYRRATLKKANDLFDAIASYGYDFRPEFDDGNIEDASKAVKKDN